MLQPARWVVEEKFCLGSSLSKELLIAADIVLLPINTAELK